ncbi:14327_t:CDS:2 [Funneliformis geosporum]|uniref:14327_t:CDS:1 n=1 Tax=Funneliformis geosporum TaxID=1117311 RepID=A0A9W4SEI6_9GLOM|nr:14327_t:CDS:2 [Funneliformis geosporum]
MNRNPILRGLIGKQLQLDGQVIHQLAGISERYGRNEKLLPYEK